jgi:hypothetical protein
VNIYGYTIPTETLVGAIGAISAAVGWLCRSWVAVGRRKAILQKAEADRGSAVEQAYIRAQGDLGNHWRAELDALRNDVANLTRDLHAVRLENLAMAKENIELRGRLEKQEALIETLRNHIDQLQRHNAELKEAARAGRRKTDPTVEA